MSSVNINIAVIKPALLTSRGYAKIAVSPVYGSNFYHDADHQKALDSCMH